MGQDKKYDRKALEGPKNGVSDQEMEWLARLMEECGELIQICAKVQRWGWLSFNPDDDDETPNGDLFRKEAEDVKDIMKRLGVSGICLRAGKQAAVTLMVLDERGNYLQEVILASVPEAGD